MPPKQRIVGQFVKSETNETYQYIDNEEDSKFEFPHKIYNGEVSYYANVMISRAKVVIDSKVESPSFETWLMTDNSHIVYPHL